MWSSLYLTPGHPGQGVGVNECLLKEATDVYAAFPVLPLPVVNAHKIWGAWKVQPSHFTDEKAEIQRVNVLKTAVQITVFPGSPCFPGGEGAGRAVSPPLSS